MPVFCTRRNGGFFALLLAAGLVTSAGCSKSSDAGSQPGREPTDTSDAAAYDKVVKHKPVPEGCWPAVKDDAEPVFIAEPQTFSSRPDSECNRIYPSYSAVRHIAGGPLDGNVLKCQLKAIDAKDYRVTFSATDMQRLRRVFPDGVCDYAKAGVNQVPVVPWASFGPAPEVRRAESTNH